MRRSTKRALIALHLEHLNSPGLVTFTRGVGTGLTGSKYITAADMMKSPVALTDLLGAASSLEGTHTQRLSTPTPALTSLEHKQAGELMDGLTDLAHFLEGLANTKAAGDVALARTIILSTGYQLRKEAVTQPKGAAAESSAKGTLDVFVPADPKDGVRLAQYSMDGGKTWSLAIVIHGNGLVVSGLKSGAEAMVRLAVSRPPGKRARTKIAAGMEDQAWGDFLTCTIQ